ncbi:MAG: hypothetical protein ACFFFB_08700 [Candidatus Heimdallarchaeota archaeon]
MSEIQRSDVGMRVFAIIGGIVAIIESILILVGIGLMPYNFGIIGGILSLICAVLATFLGIKPLHYAPTFIGVLGVGLIICAALIGGILVLIAAFIGAIS